ncbi:MAG: Ig-like domain-containing protein [bacterium]|nr:Ig-like domain-containing protein [bacterium]
MRKIEHSIKYNILSLLFLIAYIGCMFVLVVESLTPGTKSAQKSNAVGNAVGGFINDLGGDQAKEIDATGCNINLGKEHVFSVGENYKLNVETYPLDSTHKSYEYYSSDETIATVSKSGMVTFVSSGTVTIKAINTVQKEIYDEVALIVNDIMPTKLTTTILNATYNEELNCYEVEKNVSYKIDNLIEQDNDSIMIKLSHTYLR